ncbi:hypothetical protein Q5752_004488 [Cryptotrichosporon argae]
MFRVPRLAILILALALAAVLVAARPAGGPNAARIARGLPPLPPKRQFVPTATHTEHRRGASAQPPAPTES